MLLHQQRGGCGYFIWPNGGQITNKIAEQIRGRGDVQPYDDGLLPGHPQSWRLGDWRTRGEITEGGKANAGVSNDSTNRNEYECCRSARNFAQQIST